MTNIDLLLKKLDGELTEEEEEIFQNWLQESDENLEFFQKMEMLRQEGKAYHLYKSINVEKAWERVLQKRRPTQASDRPDITDSKLLQFVSYSLPIAASIVLLLGATALFYYFAFFSDNVQVQTAFGEKISFVLPDESRVVLNANSQLSYNKKQPRLIWLEGEAFFEVKKKPLTQEKFWVVTPDLKVEVLGTSFNVNSHQEQTKVYLEEGSVKLNLQNETIPEVFLIPGDILTYSSKKGATYEKIRTKAKLESSWKAGIQLFDKAPLYKILNSMENIYGVSIKLKDNTLTDLEMTMGIPVEDLSIALETIESTLGLKLNSIDAKTFVIE